MQTKSFLLYATLFFATILTGAGAATVFLPHLTSDDRLLLWYAACSPRALAAGAA